MKENGKYSSFGILESQGIVCRCKHYRFITDRLFLLGTQHNHHVLLKRSWSIPKGHLRGTDRSFGSAKAWHARILSAPCGQRCWVPSPRRSGPTSWMARRWCTWPRGTSRRSWYPPTESPAPQPWNHHSVLLWLFLQSRVFGFMCKCFLKKILHGFPRFFWQMFCPYARWQKWKWCNSHCLETFIFFLSMASSWIASPRHRDYYSPTDITLLFGQTRKKNTSLILKFGVLQTWHSFTIRYPVFSVSNCI